MAYFIDRNGQTYGPYTLDQVRGYLSGGSLLPGDTARDAATGEITTVSALLARLTPPLAPPMPFAAGGYSRPDHAPVVPMPPNLHWAVVLLLGLAFGPFVFGWMIYQMVWVRNIDRSSRALVYFLAGLGVAFVAAIAGVVAILSATNADSHSFPAAGVGLIIFAWLAMVTLHIMSVFDVRRSMLEYYNTVEPIGLRLSGVMTFFFNMYYFQHHMSRIATWKLTGYLSPQG